MKARDIFFDFIHHIFLLVLIGFVIIYFIAGDRFGNFIEIMKSLVPIGIFGIIFLIMLKLRRLELKREEGGAPGEQKVFNTEIVLFLKYFDKLKSDIIIFSLPIIILLIALLFNKEVVKIDIYQATVAFLIMYFWQKNLFNKGRQ